MFNSELVLTNLDEHIQKTILDFIELCEDLESLIERENTVLLDKGTVVFDSMFVMKINMLNRFEKEIRDVLSLAKECAPDNNDLHELLVDKIQNVRRVLSINTTFQLRDLKKRTKRMTVLKEALLDFTNCGAEGETVCH